MYRACVLLFIAIVAIDAKRSSSSPNIRENGICEGYDGVLRIRSGDARANSATAFFLYTINQLIYADMYNLVPWIHYDLYGEVFDPVKHPFSMTSFKMMDGGIISNDPNNFYPIAPILNSSSMHENTFIIKGSGIWNKYFHAINKFHLYDPSCTSKLYFLLDYRQLMPGIHYYAPWAVRAWQYSHGDKHWQHMDPRNGPAKGQSLHNWFGAMRVRAASVVKKNFKIQPWLQARVDEANPVKPGDPPCLAVDIRWFDQGNGRTRILLDDFLPYVKTYVEEGGKTIYVVTNQGSVFDIIDKEWPSSITSIMRKHSGTVLSKGLNSTFDVAVDHHSSNTVALTQIYAMSKCGLLLHGYSETAEAAIYVNVALHDYSINMNDPNHPNVDSFRTLVKLAQAQASE